MSAVEAALRLVARVRGAIAWRAHKILGDKLVYGSLLRFAGLWRTLLQRPVFIGVTGSAGKTTAKELMLGMLAHGGGGVGNPGSLNNIEEVAMAMLKSRPWHRFFVTELSEDQPGIMDRLVALMRPSVGIVTVVRDDHLSAFDSRDALALEMEKLVRALPASGTAVLNADDERVLAMAATCKARVLTYGTSVKANLRAEDVHSAWPDRLRMTVVHGEERVQVQTQLCGDHWLPSVLSAIGGGLAAGMTLKECAASIAKIPPFDGRMQPVITSDGVTFIRDDWKGTLWTVDSCFDFMRTARAKRKIIVIGTLADCGPGVGAPQKYARVAADALKIAEHTIFVGAWASHVLKVKTPGSATSLSAFRRVRDATEYINSITREGDLVLLKGTSKQDHLLRVIMARTDDVACWRDDCNRYEFCNQCSNRMESVGEPLLLRRELLPDQAAPEPSPSLFEVERNEQLIVGLGNPEPKYADTPHNVGYQVVDHLATSLGLIWTNTPEAMIARGVSKNNRVTLIKVNTVMNSIGAGLKQLSEIMSFAHEQCILVYDDLDTPIGSIRSRLSGGASGHRGVGSILEAFQTDAFRRVKVGVGKEGAKLNRAEYVLTAFNASDTPAVGQSILAANARVLEMSTSRIKAL